jgi:hypothetical protein
MSWGNNTGDYATGGVMHLWGILSGKKSFVISHWSLVIGEEKPVAICVHLIFHLWLIGFLPRRVPSGWIATFRG